MMLENKRRLERENQHRFVSVNVELLQLVENSCMTQRNGRGRMGYAVNNIAKSRDPNIQQPQRRPRKKPEPAGPIPVPINGFDFDQKIMS